jgi:hypothetical protein
MSGLSIVGERLWMRFSRAEKVMGLVRDFSVPLDQVMLAEPLSPPWWRVVHGWRVGFSLPRLRLVGRWWTRGARQLVGLRRGEPALRVVLRPGLQYDELLVSTPNAREILGQMRAAGAGRHQARREELSPDGTDAVAEDTRRPMRAAVAATVGFAGLAGFQALLATGAPYGEAAWGGGDEGRLSPALRVGSALAIAVYALAAAVILRRAGVELPHVSRRVARVGSWVVSALMALGTLANLASPSPWERFLIGPVTLAVAGLCVVVSRGPRPRRRRPC